MSQDPVTGLPEDELRALAEDGKLAGVTETEALNRALPLEAYEFAQIIKDVYQEGEEDSV